MDPSGDDYDSSNADGESKPVSVRPTSRIVNITYRMN